MDSAPAFLEPLNQLPGICADFVGRIDGVPVDTDKGAAVTGLQPSHEDAVTRLGFSWGDLQRAEQIHGADIAIVESSFAPQIWSQVDGLITQVKNVLLGVYVADCGAVYIVDPVREVIALLHSGKKGTEGNITGKAITLMQEQFGSKVGDLQVVLSPCIRPPAYEVDFAEQIRDQVIAAGVATSQYHDCAICTASNLKDYYSYRLEKGSTGRMLALLGMK